MYRTKLTAIGGIALSLVIACSDDETDPTTTTTTTTGAGAGGAGAGGAGAGGALEGGGGASGACLPSSSHADVFTLPADLCVVATYDAPFAVASYTPPSWGRHGGPMTLVQAFAGADPVDEITLTRWQLPGEPGGSLSAAEVLGPLAVGASPMAYFASVATDLPGTPWTVVAYADATFAGELVALDDDTIADRWSVNGYYWGAAVGTGTPRLVHTSQGALEDAAGATAGLYAADFCAGPALCAGGAATIDTWGNATGPLAADGAGNVFAVQTDFVSDDQTLRGFAAAAIAPGEPAVTGTDLFTVPGFGSSLAAIAPAGGAPGWVLFQPQTFDGTVVADDVVGARFSVSGDTLSAVGDASTAISFTEPNTDVSLMGDGQGRIWLGLATGASSSTFFVIAPAEG
jgi:hypothetical protein